MEGVDIIGESLFNDGVQTETKKFDWASNCKMNNFSAISWQEQATFWWVDVGLVLEKNAELNLYSASSLKQQSAGRHVTSLGHIILNLSQPVFAFTH